MDDLTGTVLKNQFFLRRLIGQGGMADVYEAWDRQRSVRLAVKVLRRSLAANAVLTSEFAKEIELVKRLSHPNIVRFYEQGAEPPDLFFFVMDFIDGVNLRDAISRHVAHYTLAETAAVLKPICTALQFAHKENVFHCDIKPANILINAQGQVLLTDFGIARLANETTQSGTPPYMAPEQFIRGAIGAYTDVYALGILTFELLSGQLPYRGETARTQGTTRQRIGWEHLNLPLPSLCHLNPQIPVATAMVVAKALSKEPADRYASAITFFNELARARSQGGFDAPENDINTVDSLQHSALVRPGPVTSRPSVITPTIISPAPAASQQVRTTFAPGKDAPRKNLPQRPQPGTWVEAELQCIQGEHQGRSFIIPKEGLSIGRVSENQLKLSEASVSRKHALIRKIKNEYIIQDLGSQLGTGVNHSILHKQGCTLQNNDIIRIGYEQVFQFNDHGKPVKKP